MFFHIRKNIYNSNSCLVGCLYPNVILLSNFQILFLSYIFSPLTSDMFISELWGENIPKKPKLEGNRRTSRASAQGL